MQKQYHVGLLQHGNTAVFQFAADVDYLDCEILEYHGQRETTIAAAKRRLLESGKKAAVLAELNARYPGRNFRHVAVCGAGNRGDRW